MTDGCAERELATAELHGNAALVGERVVHAGSEVAAAVQEVSQGRLLLAGYHTYPLSHLYPPRGDS